MDWIEAYLLPLIMIIACVWVTSVALKNIGQFGCADEIKKQAFFRPRERLNDVAVRSPQGAAGGQPDVPGQVLTRGRFDPPHHKRREHR